MNNEVIVFKGKELVIDDGADAIQITSLGEGLPRPKVSQQMLSRKFARQILDCKEWAPDRDFDAAHVDYLADCLKRGTFLPEWTIIATCMLNGEEYRLNGQHTCLARLTLDTPEFDVPITHLRYFPKTEEDMRLLYASIDRSRPRRRNEILNALLFGSENYEGVTKSLIKAAAEGLTFREKGGKAIRRADIDALAYRMKTTDLALVKKFCKLMTVLGQKDVAQHLRRSPVYAAMLTTIEKSDSASLTFWEAVKTGAELKASDPRLSLRNYLMAKAVNAGRGGTSGKTTVSGDDMYVYCIKAWNAWRKDEKMPSRFVVGNTKRPTAV